MTVALPQKEIGRNSTTFSRLPDRCFFNLQTRATKAAPATTTAAK